MIRTTFAALGLMMLHLHLQAEEYLPEMHFRSDNGMCQVFAAKPVTLDTGKIYLTVYRTCDDPLIGAFNESYGKSGFENYELNCVEKEKKFLSSSSFDNQFWRGTKTNSQTRHPIFEKFKTDDWYGRTFEIACLQAQ